MHWLERLQIIRDKPERLIIGLMSGTSLDGIDAALVRVKGYGRGVEVETLAFETMPYDSHDRAALEAITTDFESSSKTVAVCDFALGEKFSAAALNVIQKAGVKREAVDFIGSHGQTIWHQPAPALFKGLNSRATLQIGEPDVISAAAELPVVYGFRTRDFAIGGHGAPLVPYLDWILLSKETEGRIALNIGGIANLTVLPKGNDTTQITAFDTGPGNMLIDQAVYWTTDSKQEYDHNGALASSGTVDETLLSELLKEEFYALIPPKSTGREMFGQSYFEEAFERLGFNQGADLVRTITELTVRTITDAIRNFVLSKHEIARLIVSGGGTHNPVIMQRIAELLPELSVETTALYGIDADAKEAVAFALLANEFIGGNPSNLPAATGAKSACLLGKLSLPPGW